MNDALRCESIHRVYVSVRVSLKDKQRCYLYTKAQTVMNYLDFVLLRTPNLVFLLNATSISTKYFGTPLLLL